MRIYDLMPSVKKLIPFDYDKIKSDVYENIIEEQLKYFKKNKKLVQISGVPGAGKSTFCRQENGDKYLSFDNIMEKLPSYQSDSKKYGQKEAFKRNEMTARIIGYEVLRRAVENGQEIALEHSGVNDAHLELFENLQKIGYATEACFIVCDLPQAIERVEKRAESSHRYTPKSMVKSRFSHINEYMPKYCKLADDTYIYDTSTGKFVLQQHFKKEV